MKHFSHRLTLEILEDRRLLATCHVTRIGDFGAGSDLGGGHSRGDLRYCINKVNSDPGPDLIVFSVTGTINLNSALSDLSSEMEIQGPGAELLTVRRNSGQPFSIFTVSSAAAVTISGLTITNGYESGHDALGGGIANAGNLTVMRCVIADNFAAPTSFWSGSGGGIYNSTTGNLTVIESTIKDNRIWGDEVFAFQGYGAGICNDGFTSIYSSTISGNGPIVGGDFIYGGGISNLCNIIGPGGVLVLHNSTVSGNDGEYAIFSGGPLTVISHSTISGNTTGGGIYIDPDSSVYMRNTIVAENGSGGDVNGTLTNSSYNLIGNTTEGSGFDPSTDLLDVNPLLGSLQDNGSPTQTMALLPGSPAIDAGDNADAPDWDQRGPGFPRIVNGTIDIGAFEVQATGLPSFDGLAVLVTADLDADDGMIG